MINFRKIYLDATDLFEKEEYSSALILVRKLLYHFPNDMEYQDFELDILHQMQNYKAVIDKLNVMIENNPNNFEYFLKRGFAKYFNYELESGLIDFNTAIELNNYCWVAFLFKGYSEFYMENIDDAIGSFTLVIRHGEDEEECMEAYKMRAFCYCKKDMLEKAILDFTTYLKSVPDDPNAFYNRGIAYEKSGKIEQANNDFAIASNLRSES